MTRFGRGRYAARRGVVFKSSLPKIPRRSAAAACGRAAGPSAASCCAKAAAAAALAAALARTSDKKGRGHGMHNLVGLVLTLAGAASAVGALARPFSVAHPPAPLPRPTPSSPRSRPTQRRARRRRDDELGRWRRPRKYKPRVRVCGGRRPRRRRRRGTTTTRSLGRAHRVDGVLRPLRPFRPRI